MKTVDIHAHLLNSEVAFNRIYDKLAIKFFGKKLGIEPKKLLADPYNTYTNALVNMIRKSNYLDKTVLFGVDAKVNENGVVIAESDLNKKEMENHSDRKEIKIARDEVHGTVKNSVSIR